MTGCADSCRNKQRRTDSTYEGFLEERWSNDSTLHTSIVAFHTFKARAAPLNDHFFNAMPALSIHRAHRVRRCSTRWPGTGQRSLMYKGSLFTEIHNHSRPPSVLSISSFSPSYSQVLHNHAFAISCSLALYSNRDGIANAKDYGHSLRQLPV